MISKIIILFIITLVKSSTLPPSEMIWEEVQIKIDIGELILPENKRFFIFDEQNFLNEDKTSERMKALYQKQENIYAKNNIENYIFLVNEIDEKIENIEAFAKNISNFISKGFGFPMNNSIIIALSMSTKRIRIQPGNNIGGIFSENICSKMIDNIKEYLRDGNYYDGVNKLIEDIDYFYNAKKKIYEIWQQVLDAIKNEEMIIPDSKVYFIYDQKNYLKKDANITQMLELYQKQSNLYEQYGITNYIFLFDYLDDSINKDDLEMFAQEIISLISIHFNAPMSKSFIALFFNETRKLRLQPGYVISKIFSESICNQTINDIREYLESQNYYNAVFKLLENIDYIYYKNCPATLIWEKVLNATESREIIIPDNKGYFIFDEKNYSKLDINSTKMQELYQKQESLYTQYGIVSYIFFVDFLDYNNDQMDSAKILGNIISKEFNISLNKSIITLYSFNPNGITLKLGYIIERIFTESTYEELLSDLFDSLLSENYYKSMTILIKDIENYYNNNLPSTVIWEKVLNASKNGEIIIPDNKVYFIFDEQNYTKEDINSTKMQELYQKQEKIYTQYGIANYIFLIDNIDKLFEDFDEFIDRISSSISTKYEISLNKSLITLFSINSKELKIKPGKDIESTFSQKICAEMAGKMNSYVKDEKYYDAITKLFEDIDSYNNKDNKPSENDDKSDLILIIIIVVILIAIIIGGLVVFFICRKKILLSKKPADNPNGDEKLLQDL